MVVWSFTGFAEQGHLGLGSGSEDFPTRFFAALMRELSCQVISPSERYSRYASVAVLFKLDDHLYIFGTYKPDTHAMQYFNGFNHK